MKRINAEALLYYEEAAQHEFYVLRLLTYSLFAVYVVTLLVLIMLAYYYYAYIEARARRKPLYGCTATSLTRSAPN